ncbi:probable glutamate receptor [Haliotis asinina]|uniref:probable glutamate receptor n=1 Tax=Haliotis asinina TaxID=109174 RepID=UPI0035323138
MTGENGTENIDLDSIYKFHREKHLNLLVMCSSKCIIELLHQAHLAETDMMKDEKQVVSRWLVIPTSGTVKDIATTRETIKTTQLIILEAITIRHFSSHRADLVGAPIAITKPREEVVDFTVPYFYVKTGIIIKTPPATTLFTLISPFHYKVHVCLAIALVLSTTFVLILEVVTAKCFLYRPVDKLRRYGDSTFHVFGSLVYQELAQQETYTWGFDGGSSYLSLFRDSNLSDVQAIWQGIQNNRDEDPDVLTVDNDVHMRRVLEDRYAFIGDEAFLDLWKGKSCDFQMVEQQFDLLQIALGLPKNSTHTKVFSDVVHVIFESGLPRLWYNRWKPKVQCEIQKRHPYTVDLLALQSLFYLAGLGVALAVVVLVAEILHTRNCKKTRRTG